MRHALKTMVGNYLLSLVILWMFLMTAELFGQATIDPSRKIDWSSAGAAAIIARTTICSTLSAGASATDINNAIAGCPNGQVVKLGAGTFNLASGLVIQRSDVTLRGSGANQTFLVFTGSDGCTGLWTNVCVMNPAGGTPNSDNPGTVANWTAGFSVGATSLTLSTVSGLSVGAMLVLDQLDDTDTDTGEIWVCQKAGVCTPITEGGAAGRPDRAQMQFVKVTGISGTTVTFTPGLYMPNWRIGRTPQAWWITPGERVGIEDLSMDHTGAGTTPQSGIFFINQRDSWIKNLRSVNANRNHIWLYEDAHVTVRDSYFYGTQNAASQSYGIETRMGSDHLIENNIFQHITTPMMSGNVTDAVWGYNYSIDDYYTTPITWQQASSYIHDAGVDHVLMEGNDGIGFNGDNLHGTSHFATMFRNYWNGRDPAGGSDPPGKSKQTSAIIAQATQRYHNYLGNVLGTSGYHTVYECFPASSSTSTCASNANRAIYSMGWSGNEGSKESALVNDVLVRNTSFRWGNYDTFNASAIFLASEVPTALSPYGQTLPSTQVLPPSQYLSGVPSWYGTTWPPIGPDITSGELVSGHVNKIPARLCYESTSSTGGILNFDANTCYASLRQIINTGLFVNDPSGEQVRSSFVKVNQMMVDLYRRLLPSSTALTINVGSAVNDLSADTKRVAFGKINTQAAQLAAAGAVSVPTINTGAFVNDPSADTIRGAFTKVNTMTATLYAANPTTAYGPQSTIACPAGAVAIPVGSTAASRQALINANPVSTTFCLAAGTHTALASTVPKTGDIFVCAYGAILNGTGWTTADPTQAAFRAHNDDIDDVTIRNCVIRNMPWDGIRAFHNNSDRWTVEYNEITANKFGMEMPNGAILRHNYIHHNIGDPLAIDPHDRGGAYSGNGPSNVLVETNKFAFNGPEQKVSLTSAVTFRANYCDHEYNCIWYDGDNLDGLIENNIIDDPSVVGIDIEISGSMIIRNNTIRRAGESAVFISTSKDVQAYGNTLEDNWRGFNQFVNCSIVGGGVIGWDLSDNSIHDNTVKVGTRSGSFASSLDSTACTALELAQYTDGSKNLVLQSNAYSAFNLTESFWLWGGVFKTFTTWQAIPQDSLGTFVLR